MCISRIFCSRWVGLMNLFCTHPGCVEKQTAKMAEGLDPGRTLAKGEFGTSSAFDKYKEKMSLEHLVSSTVCTIRCNFSTNSSSHAHSKRALECAGFGRRLAFAWSEAGTGRP